MFKYKVNQKVQSIQTYVQTTLIVSLSKFYTFFSPQIFFSKIYIIFEQDAVFLLNYARFGIRKSTFEINISSRKLPTNACGRKESLP